MPTARAPNEYAEKAELKKTAATVIDVAGWQYRQAL